MVRAADRGRVGLRYALQTGGGRGGRIAGGRYHRGIVWGGARGQVQGGWQWLDGELRQVLLFALGMDEVKELRAVIKNYIKDYLLRLNLFQHSIS